MSFQPSRSFSPPPPPPPPPSPDPAPTIDIKKTKIIPLDVTKNISLKMRGRHFTLETGITRRNVDAVLPPASGTSTGGKGRGDNVLDKLFPSTVERDQAGIADERGQKDNTHGDAGASGGDANVSDDLLRHVSCTDKKERDVSGTDGGGREDDPLNTGSTERDGTVSDEGRQKDVAPESDTGGRRGTKILSSDFLVPDSGLDDKGEGDAAPDEDDSKDRGGPRSSIYVK